MNHFAYRAHQLFAEQVPLSAIAREVGTPTYVYSSATLKRHFRVLDQAFAQVPHLLCYSVKACPNLAVLHLFSREGAGFDIVSGGELERVLRADPDGAGKTVFSGVGKSEEELAAALNAGILMFNVESAEELLLLDRVGRSLGRKAPFAIRVNPDVDPHTHRHIATGIHTAKFGVAFAEAASLYRKGRRMRGLRPLGLDCHIGSQLVDAAPVRAAIGRVADLYGRLQGQGLGLRFLDVGGGLGITYREERPPSVEEYASAVFEPLRGLDTTLILEPGRVLVGNAGLLLTRVLYRKRIGQKQFVVVDAGMNDLIRPALYEAHHELLPVRRRRGAAVTADVVGPVCESSDVLARERRLTLPRQGELLAVMSAGAYGMSMASNYNSRRRPAEVMVEDRRFRVVRRRERRSDLWRGESP
ncbi:MAG: diaminopimelate decarboxylase [Myxococcales bacterium]|nr:diaminopimelate decarboxylase [Myxococcales bacterium]